MEAKVEKKQSFSSKNPQKISATLGDILISTD
jgi:hypothetical protein